MSGKLYTGVNGIATVPRSIYAGVNGIAQKVTTVYIGDSNGKAKKIWPSNILPNGYVQLEYIDASTTPVNLKNEINPRIDPRIIMSFEMTQTPGRAYSWDALYFINAEYYYYHDAYSDIYEYNFYCIPEYFIFTHRSNNSERQAGGTNMSEGVLLNKLYTLDFFPGDGMYLYNEAGYYSVASHNKIISIPVRGNDSVSEARTFNLFQVNAVYASPAHAKVYGAAIYNGSTLIKDLYPAKKISDNAYGFYDMVDQLFYPTLPASHTINIGPEV